MDEQDYDESYNFPRFIVFGNKNEIFVANIGGGNISTIICSMHSDKYIIKIKTIIGSEASTATIPMNDEKAIIKLLNKMGTIITDIRDGV